MTHFIIIFHDRPLPRARVDPSDKVLHMSRHQHRRIGDRCRPHANVSLLDRPHGLLPLFSPLQGMTMTSSHWRRSRTFLGGLLRLRDGAGQWRRR